jgi:hypothetical protein
MFFSATSARFIYLFICLFILLFRPFCTHSFFIVCLLLFSPLFSTYFGIVNAQSNYKIRKRQQSKILLEHYHSYNNHKNVGNVRKQSSHTHSQYSYEVSRIFLRLDKIFNALQMFVIFYGATAPEGQGLLIFEAS